MTREMNRTHINAKRHWERNEVTCKGVGGVWRNSAVGGIAAAQGHRAHMDVQIGSQAKRVP